MISGQPQPNKPDDSLDSFLTNQQRGTAPDDPALQQFHQYAHANPPARNYTAGIGIGVIVLLFAIRIVIKMLAHGN